MFIRFKIDRHKNSSSVSIDTGVSNIIQLMEQDNEIVYKGKDKVPEKKYSVPPHSDYLQDLMDHIKVVLCNLINAFQSDPGMWIAFMKRNGHYSRVKSKKGFQFASSNVNKVTGFLHKHEYTDLKTGYPASEQWKRQDSKMRFEPKIFELIPDLHQIEVYRDPTHLKRIVMKGIKKTRTVKHEDGSTSEEDYRDVVKIVTKDKAKARELDANVLKMNILLQTTKIELDNSQVDLAALYQILSSDPDKYVNAIDFTNKYLYRVFNDRSIDMHGRFYGPWYIGIPKEYRKRIIYYSFYRKGLQYFWREIQGHNE